MSRDYTGATALKQVEGVGRFKQDIGDIGEIGK
jgi:hypothetical protein